MHKWLLPFSWIYGAGAAARNWMYDHQWKRSVSFELPIISVGNLSAGGTGKTPHTEYLIRLLKDQYKTGMLSRGYMRRSGGYRLVEVNDSAESAGDEPLQVKRKFPEVTVAVCEERAIGIPIMLLDDPDLEVIILDDAFQHRRVTPGLNILLTDYSSPFTKDLLLPAGSLRESISNACRAHAIVITKTPPDAGEMAISQLKEELRSQEGQPVFTSGLQYGELYDLLEPSQKVSDLQDWSVLLVTGIASASILETHLRKEAGHVVPMRFADHHLYSESDVKKIIWAAQSLAGKRSMVCTTEKDALRLLPYLNRFKSEGVEIYCIPVEVAFGEKEKMQFDEMVLNFVRSALIQKEDGGSD